MNALPKTKPDDTRDRIMDVADRLFRQLGFAKTTVADIAAELDMSPANVYRFFPSKNAIVEAICRRCLAELDERAWEIGRSRGPARERIERLILEILAYHKANLLTDKRVNDIVLVAIEDSWDAIQAHKEVIRNVVELIIRDGIAAGEFEKVDPAETSRLFMRSVVAFVHPVLISQCLAEDEEDVEAAARAGIRFSLRAITPRT
ncbi:MAG TPA: TetR/AcrR family transcriptional regulator [Pseudolabrys sp.]|nr:TetR/AcrR family transcriptional regulator [Pseudolabrys sp.]